MLKSSSTTSLKYSMSDVSEMEFSVQNMFVIRAELFEIE
jgi:hypothetical protein